MAFEIASRKSGKGLGRITGIVVGIIILLAATYYLFFTEPPKIEVLAPPELAQIQRISELDIDPVKILESPEFQSLEKYVDPPQLGVFGRTNPFAIFTGAGPIAEQEEEESEEENGL